MRILVADQNALLLAAIAATFGRHCEIVTATRRDACLERMEQGQFDLVVACEKLVDYTGLELLSEVEAASPATLRIFAARPDSLKRLGKRLDLFGLLGTLSYPIEARKLLVALKVARSKLPARPKPVKAPPVVRHIVLEAEWDTGERLAILEQELEETPGPEEVAATGTFEVSFDENPATPQVPLVVSLPDAQPSPSQYDDESALIYFAANEESVDEPPPPEEPEVPSEPYYGEGAANDEAFADQVGAELAAKLAAAPPEAPHAAAPQPGASRAAAIATLANGAAETPAAAAKKRNGAKGPRARKPATPTAAQREAFQRALARRNAARAGGAEPDAPPIDFSNTRVPNAWVASGFGAPALPSKSLKDLARMATTKRPLPGAGGARQTGVARQTAGAWQKVQPKRRVFVVGSGIAAVLLVGVVTFELLRSTPPVEHGRHAREAQLFGPASTLVADSSAAPPQVFSAPAPQPDRVPAPMTPETPQPQTYDPDTAPPDPPPPPVLEQPGPMEPPSMAHNGPPVGMQDGADPSNGWNSD
jgi:CheY-like chemotaxis protein